MLQRDPEGDKPLSQDREQEVTGEEEKGRWRPGPKHY